MTAIRASIEPTEIGHAGGRTRGVSDTNDDLALFEQWYRAEHPRLLAALTVACGDRHLAQDVTSEAFARALAAWRRVSTMGEPSGWTYRVAVNLLHRRARRAATEARLLASLETTSAAAQSGHDAIEVWDAVGALPLVNASRSRCDTRPDSPKPRSRARWGLRSVPRLRR